MSLNQSSNPNGPTRETCAEVHGEMMAERNGKTVPEIIEASKGFLQPGTTDQYYEYFWLNLLNPDGLVCGRLAITPAEAGKFRPH